MGIKTMEYEEIRLLKQSEKSTVHLVRNKGGEQIFVRKALKGQHPVYLTLQSCSHPYLPKLYEVISTDDSTIIFEEYIEGQSLGCAELSEKQLISAVRELCVVLEFLHGKDVIHRDIKPSNIILAKDGHIRLIDFDASRVPKDDLEQDTRLLGTRGYAPPEQYGFAQTDIRADIYSLGVTLGQLLGRKNRKYRYKKIIKKCTDLNPDKRYQSVKQVERALACPYLCFWYLPVAFAAACFLCITALNRPQTGIPAPQSDETLLFEAPKSEYIIMSETDAEQDKSADMRVDMTGKGDFAEFSITYNDEHRLAGTRVKLAEGIDSGLWYEPLQELLYGIPYKQQFAEKDCVIQITCADADQDGIKEVFVTRGDGKNAVVTLVWQFIPGDADGADGLRLIGTMWGVTTMRLTERGEIKINVHNLLPEITCYYYDGFLGELEGVYLSTYKKFQENEHEEENNQQQTEGMEFDLLEAFPSGEELFDAYNVKWGIYPDELNEKKP